MSFAINAKKHSIMAGPNVASRGLAMVDDSEFELALEELERIAEAAFSRLSHTDRAEDEAVEGSVSRAVRKGAEKLWASAPLVDVVILRI